MNENQKINEVVDTTDSLEAIAAFKWMKNFLFLVIIICLLVLQGAFWLNFTGYVETAKADDSAPAVEKQNQQAPESGETEKSVSPEAEKVSTEVQAQKAVSELNVILTAAEETAAETESEEQATEESAAEQPAEEAKAEAEAEEMALSSENFSFKQEHITAAVKISNFVLVLTATLYSLVLLMALKISLAGRLGGISHISRGFFLSLFALVILLPWQRLFPGVVIGAMFTPAELFNTPIAACGSKLFCQVAYFARFTGMWLIVVILMLAAQVRTARWSKTTLKRLGMLR